MPTCIAAVKAPGIFLPVSIGTLIYIILAVRVMLARPHLSELVSFTLVCAEKPLLIVTVLVVAIDSKYAVIFVFTRLRIALALTRTWWSFNIPCLVIIVRH